MIQLDLTDDLKNNVQDGTTTAWRLECSLREFRNFEPRNFWFDYPIHRVDSSGELETANAEGSMKANLQKAESAPRLVSGGMFLIPLFRSARKTAKQN